MAFTHGKCGGQHDTVADARICEGAGASHTPFEDEPKQASIPKRKGPAEEGFYKQGNVYFKVQEARNGSGRRYAKILYLPEVEGGKPHWEYAPGVVMALSEEDRLTAEEAAAFGKLYGICIFCNRDLTDERSIYVGYGAKCAENQGLPWGETG